jgi:hypothetical protein
MNQNLSTLTKIGNWIATLLLGNTREIIIRIDERLNNLIVEVAEFKVEVRADFKEIRETLKDHGEFLREHGENIAALKAHTGYNIRNSPSVPSEKGRRLLEDSGFNEIYPLLRQRIFALIKEKEPKTLYDCEKEAERALRSLRDDPLVYQLKDYVVEHSEEPLVLIFEIASWVVRDDYAKEHPFPKRTNRPPLSSR